MDLQQIALNLSSMTQDGERFDCLLIPGEQEVLQVDVEGYEELPIYITITEEQILCIAYLFSQEEIREDALADLHTKMLELNIPMPLSAFAKIDNRYAVFGALSVGSSMNEIAHEVATLAINAMDALEACEDVLA
jgi:uncharacterized protein